MKDNDEKNIRDFSQRPSNEQQDFMENTWCDHCLKENLGLVEPCEYELAGVIFIEGKCKQCANVVTTELTEDEF